MGFCTYLITLVTFTAILTNADSSALAPLDKEYQMPASCEGKDVCLEKLADYPYDRIKEVLKDFQSIEEDLGTPIEFGDRDGVPTTCSNDDCPTACSNDDLAYYIRDTNDQIRVVIQADELLKQKVTLRWCQKEGPIVDSTDNILFPWEYGISCETKYMDFEFFVLSQNHTHVERAKPKNGIPICCVCIDGNAEK